MPTKRKRISLLPDSEAQVEQWKEAASLQKRSLPNWIRLTLDEAAAAQVEADREKKAAKK